MKKAAKRFGKRLGICFAGMASGFVGIFVAGHVILRVTNSTLYGKPRAVHGRVVVALRVNVAGPVPLNSDKPASAKQLLACFPGLTADERSSLRTLFASGIPVSVHFEWKGKGGQNTDRWTSLEHGSDKYGLESRSHWGPDDSGGRQ